MTEEGPSNYIIEETKKNRCGKKILPSSKKWSSRHDFPVYVLLWNFSLVLKAGI